jgi:hypothetical protein
MLDVRMKVALQCSHGQKRANTMLYVNLTRTVSASIVRFPFLEKNLINTTNHHVVDFQYAAVLKVVVR